MPEGTGSKEHKGGGPPLWGTPLSNESLTPKWTAAVTWPSQVTRGKSGPGLIGLKGRAAGEAGSPGGSTLF